MFFVFPTGERELYDPAPAVEIQRCGKQHNNKEHDLENLEF